MSSETLELEGTWEEIAARAPEFAGRRVRLTLMPEEANGQGDAARAQRTLEAWERYKAEPISAEDQDVLEGFEAFRKAHPVTFRVPEER